MEKRVSLEQAKTDIKNAFNWLESFRDRHGLPTHETLKAAERATAFLAQCEADQARLRAAMIACQTLVEFDTVTDNPDDLRDAIEQARSALAD